MIYIFDIDNTLYKGSTVRTFLPAAFREGIIPRSIVFVLPYYFFLFRGGNVKASITRKRIRALQGFSEAAMAGLAGRLFREKIKKGLNDPVLQEIRKAKEKGAEVVLATSSFRILVEPIAEYVGADTIIASEIGFSGGISTGYLQSLPPYREGKKARVMDHLSAAGREPGDIVFYTDHHDDLPLLFAAGRPVAVNPTRKLRRIARKRHWDLLEGPD